MSDEPDDEWSDEDDDDCEAYCLQCRRYCDPVELFSQICWMCLDEDAEENTCPDK